MRYTPFFNIMEVRIYGSAKEEKTQSTLRRFRHECSGFCVEKFYVSKWIGFDIAYLPVESIYTLRQSS